MIWCFSEVITTKNCISFCTRLLSSQQQWRICNADRCAMAKHWWVSRGHMWQNILSCILMKTNFSPTLHRSKAEKCHLACVNNTLIAAHVCFSQTWLLTHNPIVWIFWRRHNLVDLSVKAIYGWLLLILVMLPTANNMCYLASSSL